MKVIGIVDNTTMDDNSHTLVKVALKYIKTFKVDTEIIDTDSFDFTEGNNQTDLVEKLNDANALIVATSLSFPDMETDVEPFLQWVEEQHLNPDTVVGTMLLVEPNDSLKEYDEDHLSKIFENKGMKIITNQVFTKLEESADARSNTYILTQAMKCGEDIAHELTQK